MSESTPSVNIKRKNIQGLIDYCVESRIEFSAKPAFASNDEWEVSFSVDNIKKAIALGMFLKELKVELKGLGTATAQPAALPRQKKETKQPAKEEAPAEKSGLALNAEGLMFDVEG